jgi:hypothetical protein
MIASLSEKKRSKVSVRYKVRGFDGILYIYIFTFHAARKTAESGMDTFFESLRCSTALQFLEFEALRFDAAAQENPNAAAAHCSAKCSGTAMRCRNEGKSCTFSFFQVIFGPRKA